MALSFHKVASLPPTLAANAVYAVRPTPTSALRLYVTSAGPTVTAHEFGPPPPPPLLSSGDYFDNAVTALAPATIAGAANRIDLAPLVVPVTIAIDEVSVAVATAVAGAFGQIMIYTSDANNLWPDFLSLSTPNLDFSTTGSKSLAIPYTLEAGVRYWVGVWHSSTATLRGVALGSLAPIVVAGANGTSYFTGVRRTAAYGGAAPDPWAYASGQRISAVMPSIRFRVA